MVTMTSDDADWPPGLPDHLRPASLRFQLASPGVDLRERAEAAARRTVGVHGLVQHCQEQPPVPGVASVSVHIARGPRRGLTGRAFPAPITGTGVAVDRELSWLQAVVEALERYCMVWPRPATEMLRAPLHQVERWAVPLERFALFSEAQYRTSESLRLPGPDEAIDWTWAYSLTRNDFALVPAALVHPWLAGRPPNTFARGLSSTGTAAHVSVERAVVSGLYEVVERDALMITWLNRRSPPRLALDATTPAPLVGLIEEHFDVADIDFTFLDLSADCPIPTVGCVATSAAPHRPAALVGAATRADPAEAAAKALFEVVQLLSGLRDRRWDQTSVMAAAEVRTLDDHARFYATAAGAKRLRNFASAGPSTAWSALPGVGKERPGGELQACVELVAGVGLEVLVVDVTAPDVAQCGLRAVKVLVPGMVDINGDPRFPLLGSTRISSVPRALGWTSVGDHDVNLEPCPLA